MVEVPKGKTGIVEAAPEPYEFFRAIGTGESGFQDHAGSYHMAMNRAGIQKGNLIIYSSMLSEIATEIDIKEGYRRIKQGAQVGIIQAKSEVDLETGVKRATAALLFGWLRPKSRRDKREHAGGIVCEYNKHGDEKEALENLMGCMQEIYKAPDIEGISYCDRHNLDVQPMQFVSFVPKKRFGTALSMIAYVSYHRDVLAQNAFATKEDLEKALQDPLGIAKEK